MSLIKSQYNNTFRFFKEHILGFCIVCGLCFAVLTVVFHFNFAGNQEMVTTMIESLMASFEQKGLVAQSNGMMFLALLQNNIIATLMAMLAGIIPVLFLPVLVLVTNSMVMGVVSSYSMSLGMSWSILIMGILPHGIFEIPALIISVALGINLCYMLTRKIFTPKRIPEKLGEILLQTARCYGLVVLPLLVVAAFIEAFATSAILNAMV